MKRYFPHRNTDKSIADANVNNAEAEVPKEAVSSATKPTAASTDEEGSSDSESSSSEEDAPIAFRRSKPKGPAVNSSSERRQQSIAMAKAASATEIPQHENDVDDTDGLDPEKEYNDWKQRELARIRREYVQIEAIESEMQARLESRRKRLKSSE